MVAAPARCAAVPDKLTYAGNPADLDAQPDGRVGLLAGDVCDAAFDPSKAVPQNKGKQRPSLAGYMTSLTVRKR